ncbi:hypothetical protein MTO96_041538 [Rhipicephalus appendiculatus]
MHGRQITGKAWSAACCLNGERPLVERIERNRRRSAPVLAPLRMFGADTYVFMQFLQLVAHLEPGDNPQQAWEDRKEAYNIYRQAWEHATNASAPRRDLLLHVHGPHGHPVAQTFPRDLQPPTASSGRIKLRTSWNSSMPSRNYTKTRYSRLIC